MVDLKQAPGVHTKDSLQSEVIDGTDMALETMLQAFQIAEQFDLSMEEILLEAEDRRKHPGHFPPWHSPEGEEDGNSDLREYARHCVAEVCAHLIQYCQDSHLPFSDVLRYAVRTHRQTSSKKDPGDKK